MCGILGLVRRSERVDVTMFEQMLGTLQNRGPDCAGIYYEERLALGHRRLSVIDLSENGKQPMFNEDGQVALVVNGEIYNYLEIRKDLKKKHIWRSKTDSEVLVHGYEECGQSIVDQLEGMFAYAIYDREQHLISLARDPFGKKPLYYYLDDETFCFASELKAIIRNPHIKANVSVSPSSLLKFLFYGYIPSPDSIYAKIRKVEPSTALCFDIRSWRIIDSRRFWKLENIAKKSVLTEQLILSHLDELVRASVKKRMISDVPLGVFLSGGVDSSLITAYMSHLSSDINAFTVCYRNSPEADEAAYAKRVSKILGTKLHLCYFEDESVLQCFSEILNYLDEPMADAAIIPLYYISKFAKQRITVVLSGDGGDEIFGGYPKYKAQNLIERFKYFRFLGQLAKPFLKNDNPFYKLPHSLSFSFPVRQFIFGTGGFLPFEAKLLLNLKNIDLDLVFEDSIKYSQEFPIKDAIDRSLYLDCKIQLPDWYLVKSDRATMACSLEMRNPLLDKNIAEFAFSLPQGWKIRRGEEKYLLKKLAAQYVDQDIIYRKKRGFGVPLDKWIREDLNDLMKEHLFNDYGFFNMGYVRKLYEEHINKTVDHRFKLLRIFGVNYWMARYHV